MTKNSDSLTALNENGKSTDWWFIYKISGESKSSKNIKIDGAEYVYYDDIAASKNKKLELSVNKINQKAGALFETLNQLDWKKHNKNRGWFFYNDENPSSPKNFKNPNTNLQFKPNGLAGSRGHTKGVLSFDLSSDSGFWIIHSTPKFSPPVEHSFPKTGIKMAQTFLCISLKNAVTAMKIAQQMYMAQQPNVYAASKIPIKLEKLLNDDRILLMKNQIASGRKPFVSKLPFLSKNNQRFLAIAKNKHWGLDFYNDLVGPALHENLEVETWEHGKTPLPADSDKIHKVVAMKSIDLNQIDIPISWSEESDHAKITISDKGEKIPWVCVGDINFTIAQEKRGGGTIAFQCKPLWEKLDEIFSTKNIMNKKISKKHSKKRA